MSDTPRTDELEYDGIGISNFGHQDLYYAYKFARQLERELNAMTRERDIELERATHYRDRWQSAEERIKRLEEAGDAMSTYAHIIDFQNWKEAKEAKP